MNTKGMELVVTISVADRASTEVVRDDCDNPSTFFKYSHLHTVHAIASCNAAEIATGMLEATVPTSHRWIPKARLGVYLSTKPDVGWY